MPDRPKTLIMHHRSGIGDLVWHIPYFRAIGASSRNGKASLMARPSARAADLLAAEDWLEQIIEFDRRPRRQERRSGRHDGLWAQLGFAADLRRLHFDRVFIFSGRVRYAWLAALAGIPRRSGFGFSPLQRLWLNQPPYIAPHSGPGNWVYPEASAFAIAHGLVQAPLLPRMQVLTTALAETGKRLAPLPRPLVAFAIGASEAAKNWGGTRFGELADHLTASGCGIVLLGGPAEQALAEQIRSGVAASCQDGVLPMAQPSLQSSAAVLRLSDCCVGNDTGVLNMAAACGCHAVGLFGATPKLNHDPLIDGIEGQGMDRISVAMVERRVLDLLGKR